MTEQPRAAGPESAGPAPDGSGRTGPSTAAGADRVVIRDNRKIDQPDAPGDAVGAGGSDPADVAGAGGKAAAAGPDDGERAGAGDGAAAETADRTEASDQAEAADRAEATDQADVADEAEGGVEGSADLGAAGAAETGDNGAGGTGAGPAGDAREGESSTPVEDGEIAEVLEAETPTGPDGPVVDEPAQPVEPAPAEGRGPLGAELEALRAELDERTRDLQRVSAEYSNYRKRVDRDRGKVAEQATGAVLAALLPMLDDLDRAREHGDLVGPFGTVAEQLVTALGKFGLTPFGEPGEPFDPTRHEAVSHQTSAEVTEPTCVTVMRRGYLHGDRLLRAALVGVADPE